VGVPGAKGPDIAAGRWLAGALPGYRISLAETAFNKNGVGAGNRSWFALPGVAFAARIGARPAAAHRVWAWLSQPDGTAGFAAECRDSLQYFSAVLRDS